MLSIDQEIGIESKDCVPIVDLGHANDTGVRHGSAPVSTIAPLITAQALEMLRI
jgi:hypothetical protein